MKSVQQKKTTRTAATAAINLRGLVAEARRNLDAAVALFVYLHGNPETVEVNASKFNEHAGLVAGALECLHNDIAQALGVTEAEIDEEDDDDGQDAGDPSDGTVLS